FRRHHRDQGLRSVSRTSAPRTRRGRQSDAFPRSPVVSLFRLRESIRRDPCASSGPRPLTIGTQAFNGLPSNNIRSVLKLITFKKRGESCLRTILSLPSSGRGSAPAPTCRAGGFWPVLCS